MRARVLGAGIAIALAALAGCASEPAPRPFDVPPESAGTTAPTRPVETPEQIEMFGPRVELAGGMLLKELGKVAQWGGTASEVNNWAVRLVVDSIEVDPNCGEFVPEPERGHRLLVTMRVETNSAYDAMRHGVPQYYEWSTIGTDGVSEAPPSSAYPCEGAAELPHELRPSAKYRGSVLIETANAEGQLVLADLFAWNYPAASS